MKLERSSIIAAIVLVLILTAPSLRADDQADNTPGTRLGARNLDGGSEAYGEVQGVGKVGFRGLVGSVG